MKNGPFKPGSRVQAVWEAYEKGGQQAAFEFGATQDLAESTLLSWIRGWAKNAKQPSEVKASGSKPKAAKAGSAPVITPTTVRVRQIGFSKGRHGTVKQPGPEVSLVKWDDAEGNRHDCVTNEHLIKLLPSGEDDEEAKTDWQRKEDDDFWNRRWLKSKASPGSTRMKENLGAEGAETLRSTVLDEQQAAMDEVKEPRKKKRKGK